MHSHVGREMQCPAGKPAGVVYTNNSSVPGCEIGYEITQAA